jgi:hypothetical protein
MDACAGSTAAPDEARYMKNSESPHFFSPNDARRISQYSCLAPFS